MDDCISRKAAIDALADYIHNIDKVIGTGRLTPYDCKDAAISVLEDLPSVQPDFDITVKIDKAYDNGYEAGYLQGRHDWGDLDE